MPQRSEFVEHVVETMRLFGPVEAKRMFGAWGLYHRATFFALIADDTLYLKADDETRAEFAALGLETFTFELKGGTETIETSYYRAPDEALESPPVMAEWARKGYGAALRAAARKKTRTKAKTTTKRK